MPCYLLHIAAVFNPRQVSSDWIRGIRGENGLFCLYGLTEIRPWIRTCIHVFLRAVITHPCHSCKGGSAKPPFNLGRIFCGCNRISMP